MVQYDHNVRRGERMLCEGATGLADAWPWRSFHSRPEGTIFNRGVTERRVYTSARIPESV
jgi:hypothetical protein